MLTGVVEKFKINFFTIKKREFFEEISVEFFENKTNTLKILLNYNENLVSGREVVKRRSGWERETTATTTK